VDFFTDAEGVLHHGLLTHRFEAWAATKQHIVGRVIAVTQAGDGASVLLGFDNPADPSASWVDVHALLRVDGRWKITNKTATHSSRAAWAAAQQSPRQDTLPPSAGQGPAKEQLKQ
jgi:hypothetical protein